MKRALFLLAATGSMFSPPVQATLPPSEAVQRMEAAYPSLSLLKPGDYARYYWIDAKEPDRTDAVYIHADGSRFLAGMHVVPTSKAPVIADGGCFVIWGSFDKRYGLGPFTCGGR